MKIKLKKLGRRGVMYAWITILVSIFVVILLYVLFDNMIRTELYNIAIARSVDANLLNNLVSAWTAFPYVFIFGMFLYGLVRSQKSEYDTGYYP